MIDPATLEPQRLVRGGPPGRLFVTAVRRLQHGPDNTGVAYCVDWGAGRVVWRRDFKEGARGLLLDGDRLLMATARNEILQLDPATGHVLDRWCFPPIAFLHLIYQRGRALVAPSTGNDSVAQIDLASMKLLRTYSITGSSSNTLHLNSMGWDADGDSYRLYHTPGIVVRGEPTWEAVIFEGLPRAHDLEFIDDYEVVINDSVRRRLVVGDVRTGVLRELYQVPDGPSTTVSQWGWTRGAAYDAPNAVLYAGSAPVDIHRLDFATGAHEVLRLSETVEESIFDICIDRRSA